MQNPCRRPSKFCFTENFEPRINWVENILSVKLIKLCKRLNLDDKTLEKLGQSFLNLKTLESFEITSEEYILHDKLKPELRLTKNNSSNLSDEGLLFFGKALNQSENLQSINITWSVGYVALVHAIA